MMIWMVAGLVERRIFETEIMAWSAAEASVSNEGLGEIGHGRLGSRSSITQAPQVMGHGAVTVTVGFGDVSDGGELAWA